MKLEFRLLVVDDNPDDLTQIIGILSDHLKGKGFSLKPTVPNDFSAKGLRNLAAQSGKDFDLVMVDYNLGGGGRTGADATVNLRNLLPYTDMVFYSSDPSHNLFDELAKKHLAGVFIGDRSNLSDTLVGLANTVINKAVDLNHMRGIAMAEVADMDVLMEETLERVFSLGAPCFDGKAQKTLVRLVETATASLETITKVANEGAILEAVTDSRLFSSAQKYAAIRRVAQCLPEKPSDALEAIKGYEADIINNRNTLAHAKEDTGEGGVITLRSIKRGAAPIVIDEAWLVDFRSKLHKNREALRTICTALQNHIASGSAVQNVEEA